MNSFAEYNIDKTFLVELNDSPVELKECPKTGVYTVYVYPKSLGPSAQFNISYNNLYPSIVRANSNRSSINEQLDMEWNTDCHPKLFYRPYMDEKREFIVRIIGLNVPILFCGY